MKIIDIVESASCGGMGAGAVASAPASVAPMVRRSPKKKKRKKTSEDIDAMELRSIEAMADKLFRKVGIDVNFTNHFSDRVNDLRNGNPITSAELVRLFKQEYKKWGKPIAQMGPDAEGTLKDLQTDINVPFVLIWDRENQELDMVTKTIMRKPNFRTHNREFPIGEAVEKDIPREHMPQIDAEDVKNHYQHKTGTASIDKLTCAQQDRVPGKVDSIVKDFEAGKEQKPMTIDIDGYIVDGHHRYDAFKQMGQDTVPVTIINAKLAELVKRYQHKTDDTPTE